MPRGRPRKTDEALLKSAELIGWALGGLEREIAQTKERLGALMEQASRLRARLGRNTPTRAASQAAETGEIGGRRVRRRKMSAEARKRISENMKKRWAERKKRGLRRL